MLLRYSTSLAIVMGMIGLLGSGASTLAGPKVIIGQSVPPDRLVSIDRIDQRTWHNLLMKYVDQNGNVDYAAWKRSSADERSLDNYLATLSYANPNVAGDRRAILAFWINAYNAGTVKGILREYPTSSIRNHTAKFSAYNIWKDLMLTVGGQTYSLDQIEHELLRKMGEPRIHFAIVCAAHSCPRLLNEAYHASSLEQQLAANARHFFATPANFRFDEQNRVFYLSSIMQWFGEDFGANQAAQLKAISGYLPNERAYRAAQANNVRVSYLEYDWSLNDRATAQQRGRHVTQATQTSHGVQSSNVSAQSSATVNSPNAYFQSACENCRGKQHGVAASQIRKAASLLREKSKHATEKGRQVLAASINELEAIAKSVESGTVGVVGHAEAAFARAHHALAYHHEQLASESWLARNAKQTGHNLKAASEHLRQSFAWQRKPVTQPKSRIIEATQSLGRSLVEGTQAGVQEVGSGAAALRDEIERLGNSLLVPKRR